MKYAIRLGKYLKDKDGRRNLVCFIKSPKQLVCGNWIINIHRDRRQFI